MVRNNQSNFEKKLVGPTYINWKKKRKGYLTLAEREDRNSRNIVKEL